MFETLKNAWKITELRKKILYTLGMLLLYRFLCFVPTPGVNTANIASTLNQYSLLNYINSMTGSDLANYTIMAMGITPYINSSIIMQLLCVAIRLTVKSGGSLAEVVQKITNLIRARIDFRRRLSALTAQGRFEALAMSLAPLAAFILLFLADRELMIPLVTTVIGWSAIAGVVVLETVGYFVIRKIIDIDV